MLLLLLAFALSIFAAQIRSGDDHQIAVSAPFGITFGPTTITASRVNASGHAEIFMFGATSGYENYFTDAVAHYGQRVERQGRWYTRSGKEFVPAPTDMHDETLTRAMFRDNMLLLEQGLGDEFQKPAGIVSSLFLPAVFNFSTALASRRAVFETSHGVEPMKVGYKWQSACEAYAFHECKHLGREPIDCDEYRTVNSVLVMEYEEDYLYIALVDVEFEWGGYAAIHEEVSHDCGHKFAKDLGTGAHEQRLRGCLINFITSYHSKVDVSKSDNIRAILGFGEVSSSAMARLENIALAIVGSGVRVMNGIPHTIVAAEGSAKYALKTQLRPSDFTVHAPQMQSEPEHDEL